MTNTLVPPPTPGPGKISVAKVWSDSNNAAKARPDKVTIHLLANDVDTGKSVELSAANRWKASFDGLAAKTDEGTKIVYRVTEDAVENYTSKVTVSGSDSFTVTNTYKAPTTTTTTKGKTTSSASSTSTPRTGDPLTVLPFGVLACLSAVFAAIAFAKRRKNGAQD